MLSQEPRPGEGGTPARDDTAQLAAVHGALGVQVGSYNVQLNFYGSQTWAGHPARPPLAGSPYRGLDAFEERDAGMFFGRDEVTGTVLDKLAGRASGPGLVAVLGASGAGKSSLLRAGVLPRLRRDGLAGVPGSAAWPCLLFEPGPAPLEELAIQTAVLAGTDASTVARSLAANPAGFADSARQAAVHQQRQGGATGSPSARLLLIVDQFEQLFTACEREDQRRAFIVALHAAATAARGPGRLPSALVVLGVRADFETHCLDYPELIPAIQDRYLVPPMTARQLRLAISGPATAAGSSVQPDLVEVLVHEISDRKPASPGGYAGTLPLLSHALDEAWRTRTGDSLTLADYERTGGIETAVARSAQEAYEQLTPARQAVARQVFLQLTATSLDGTDTAVPAVTARLTVGTSGTGESDVAAVLEAFTERRLLTMTEATVEVTHEVLLTAWPLLRDSWLAGTHADRVIRTGLSTAAASWVSHARDSAYLYTGSLLETVLETADRVRTDPARYPPLNHDEEAFLAASSRARRRRTRTLQTVVAILSALTVALAVITVLAIGQRNTANIERAQALAARDRAASNALAAQSQATGDADPALARLEAVAAWHLNHSAEAEYAMLKAAALPGIAVLSTGARQVESMAFSPDGTILADGATGPGVQLWDTATHRLIAALQVGVGANAVAFSPLGATLAIGTDSDTVQLWDTATRQLTATFQAASPVDAVAFSPDGTTLADGADQGAVRLWDLAAESATIKPVATLPGFDAVAFAPDGKTMAADDAASSSAVQLRDTATRRVIGTLPAGLDSQNNLLAFSPVGTVLAIGTKNGVVQLWDSATGRLMAKLRVGRDSISSVAFAPDGTTLAVGTDGGTVQLWDMADGRLTATLSVGDAFTAATVAFSPHSTTLAVGTGPGSDTVQLWDTATRRLAGVLKVADTVQAIAFSPDGTTLAVSTQSGPVQLWDTATHRLTAALQADAPGELGPVAFSPNGQVLAIDIGAVEFQLWDVATGQQLSTLGATASEADFPTLGSMAFIPGSTLLAVVNSANAIQLWSIPYLTDTAAYLCGLARQPFPPAEWAQQVTGVPYQKTCA